MAVVVAPLDDTTDQVEAWDRYVDGQPQATIYHYSPWHRIFGESFGYRSWMLAARDQPRGDIVGILPLYLVPRPFARRLVSVPFRDRGGVLWDSPEAFRALVIEARQIAQAVGASSVWLKSLFPYPQDHATAIGLTESRYWLRSTVTLDGMSAEGLWQTVGDKNRNMVRQAQRHGLGWEPLDTTASALAEWHRLHVTSQKRLGIPPFPRQFFVSMSEQLRRHGRFAMFGARRKGVLHTAAILLLHRDMAVYAYAASDADGQSSRGNDLLLFEVMRWLIERRISILDLGSDSPLQESLLFFKRKWLAQQAPIPHYSFGHDAPTDSSDPRYALLRKCFSSLPAPVLSVLGSAISRYFG